jgi:hypothetical protein
MPKFGYFSSPLLCGTSLATDLRSFICNTWAGHERATSTALSKIESDVAPGLAAGDQQIAIRRRFDRVWPIDDGAGNQPGLAVMTNSGAARPTHRHIASLG